MNIYLKKHNIQQRLQQQNIKNRQNVEKAQTEQIKDKVLGLQLLFAIAKPVKKAANKKQKKKKKK